MPSAASRSRTLVDFTAALRRELHDVAQRAGVRPRFREYGANHWWCAVTDTRNSRRVFAATGSSAADALCSAIRVRDLRRDSAFRRRTRSLTSTAASVHRDAEVVRVAGTIDRLEAYPAKSATEMLEELLACSQWKLRLIGETRHH